MEMIIPKARINDLILFRHACRNDSLKIFILNFKLDRDDGPFASLDKLDNLLLH